METKRKSKFPIILLVITIIIGVSFTFGVNQMKDRYRVLDTKSNEVSTMLSEIKDYRKIAGYKVIKDTGDYKILLISAGLTFGKDDNLEVTEVTFDSDKVKIVVKENIEKNPEVETVKYPYVLLKVDTDKDRIEVVNTNGDVYKEIDLHDETAGIPNPEENVNKEEIDTTEEDQIKEETDTTEEDQIKDVVEDEQEDSEETEIVEEEKPEITYVTGEYQGRIDGTSIEVKIGNDYDTFDISGMAMSFENYSYGTKLKLGYINKNGSKVLISVSK